MKIPYLVLFTPLAFLASLGDRPARADDPTVTECLSASNLSVELRSAHKLRQARAQLLVCAAASCPEEVRTECLRRLEPIRAALPTVVFEVKDGAGHELADVKITMDGDLVATHLDGSALTLDPGSHEFTFEVEGQPPLTESLILHEGEKNRRETVVVGTPPKAPETPAIAPPPPNGRGATSDVAPASGSHTLRLAGIVTGAAGILGLGLGGVFGGVAISSWHSAQSSSSNAERNTALTFATASDAAFIVGGVLVAGGVTLYLVSRSGGTGGSVGGHPQTPGTPTVGLQIMPGGLGAVGTF
jgi:hypothetical protein